MLIGIDASKTTSKTKTGIDNTAYQIILGLTKIDKANKYNLYTNKPLDSDLLKNPNFSEKLIPFPRFWNRFRLPLALLKDKPDVFIELTNSIPTLAPKKTIVLIHDLAFKFFPEAYSKYELMLQETAINIAMSKASAIVFTGQASLDDLIKFYGKPRAQISVVPLAYDNKKFNRTSIVQSDKKERYHYFLSVGRIEKRKNTANIIRAFELFKTQNSTNHKLILVGKNGFGHKDAEEAISNSKFKDDIIRKGYLEENELPLLYKNADALVYPSLYEGFGLPALEAMASGTPVITSDIPTIKETAKNGALYVNPKNPDSIAKAMERVIFDQTLRISLIKKGYEVAKEYSWKKTAEQFYKVIESI